MTLLTLHCDVSHKLHLDSDRALALALLTAAALGIEREISRTETHLLSPLLVGKQTPYLIVGLEISSRIAACRPSDRILVDKFHGLHPVQIASERIECSRSIHSYIETPCKRAIKHIAHQSRLAASAHSGHYSDDSERKFHIDILQIVFSGALYLYKIAPRASVRRHRDRHPSVEIGGRITALDIGQRRLSEPSFTMRPPLRPASDPTSIRWSASRIISSSCSTITTVLPMSRKRLSTLISHGRCRASEVRYSARQVYTTTRQDCCQAAWPD